MPIAVQHVVCSRAVQHAMLRMNIEVSESSKARHGGLTVLRTHQPLDVVATVIVSKTCCSGLVMVDNP